MSVKRIARALASRALGPLGLEVRGVEPPPPDARAWAFPYLVEQARLRGMDVNDYQETLDGWEPAASRFEALLGRHLQAGSRVCEIGPGTGRWSRHVAARIPGGELHLVDHSPWLCDFLRGYFATEPRIRVNLNDGVHLGALEDGSLDLVFSVGSFVAMNLGVIMRYAQEIRRALRGGGVAVLDYIDVAQPEGWDWLERHCASAEYAQIYTFHHRETMHRVFASAGLAVVEEARATWSTFLTLRRSD